MIVVGQTDVATLPTAELESTWEWLCALWYREPWGSEAEATVEAALRPLEAELEERAQRVPA